MAEFEFTKGTNSEHKISLNGQFVSARWLSPLAIGGRTAELIVSTVLIGNGAPIEITFTASEGKKPSKIKGKLDNNRFRGEIEIPRDVDRGARLSFTAKLTKHDLTMDSESITLLPPLEVSGLKWNKADVQRGDVVTMLANAPTLPDEQDVILAVYEHNPDSGAEAVTEIPTKVKDGKIRADLEFQYFGRTQEIPTKKELEPQEKNYVQPMYFFTVRVAGEEFGAEKDSGLLAFFDFIDLVHRDAEGNPTADLQYKITLADGSVLDGSLDKNGEAHHDKVMPGRYQVFFEEENEEG